MILTLPYRWTNVLVESQQDLQISRRKDLMPFRRERQNFRSLLSLSMSTVVRVCGTFGHVIIETCDTRKNWLSSLNYTRFFWSVAERYRPLLLANCLGNCCDDNMLTYLPTYRTLLS